ncbi:uncharacterized protein LOC141704389 [Apium graveolens]|uniref:uncharacterized protein LOC141704389 n=1 Tax=Apium graveolens TaxID=4045 RepID=UPI003D7A8807
MLFVLILDCSYYDSYREMRKSLGLPDQRLPVDFCSDSDEDELEDDDEIWMQKQCNSMLEIVGIVYLGEVNVEPRNQLGRIYMASPVGILDIYNVGQVDEEDTRETLQPGDEFDVKDIKGPIPFQNDCNSLDIDLFHGAFKGHIYDVFANKQFYSRDDAYLQEVKLASTDGTGDIVLLMGFYAHATIARVEVRLKTSVAVNVHGCISASNTELDKCRATSVLFLKQQQKRIIVGTDGLIPLSRSLVAVPYDSQLFLNISLVVDGHLLEPTISFFARKTGVSTKSFQNLSVTVNWEALYYHSKKVNKA